MSSLVEHGVIKMSGKKKICVPSKRQQRITISVVGGHEINSEVERMAHRVGEIIAEVGGILVCGGLFGVMEAVAKGAKEAGGLTIGILPGKEKTDANPFIDIALPTSIGFARNVIVACSADIVIALPGSHGTRTEISYALVYKRPVIDLGSWGIKGMIKAQDIHEAEKIVKEYVQKLSS